jgi:hypothetical protein
MIVIVMIKMERRIKIIMIIIEIHIIIIKMVRENEEFFSRIMKNEIKELINKYYKKNANKEEEEKSKDERRVEEEEEKIKKYRETLNLSELKEIKEEEVKYKEIMKINERMEIKEYKKILEYGVKEMKEREEIKNQLFKLNIFLKIAKKENLKEFKKYSEDILRYIQELILKEDIENLNILLKYNFYEMKEKIFEINDKISETTDFIKFLNILPKIEYKFIKKSFNENEIPFEYFELIFEGFLKFLKKDENYFNNDIGILNKNNKR